MTRQLSKHIPQYADDNFHGWPPKPSDDFPFDEREWTPAMWEQWRQDTGRSVEQMETFRRLINKS
jgi:hypothetical protein